MNIKDAQQQKKQNIYNEGNKAAMDSKPRKAPYKGLDKLFWNMGYDDGLTKLYDILEGK